jgi:hypothetical protein
MSFRNFQPEISEVKLCMPDEAYRDVVRRVSMVLAGKKGEE